MFGSLKEKLKNWTAKVKEEVFGKEEPEEKPKKTTKKTKTTRTTKKEKPKKTTIKKAKADKTSSKKPSKESKPKKQKKEVSNITELPSKVAEVTEERSDEQEIQEEESTEPEIEQEQPKQGFFSKMFKSELTQEKFQELFQELELHLLQNNVAYEVVEKIKQELSSRVVGKKNYFIEKELKEIIQEILIEPPNFIEQVKSSLKNKKPFVIALLGINGAGKTTAIAKLTHLLQKNKFSVCFAAADTYRAASIEQLEVHANRLNVPIIKKDYGSDPASVGFEAIQYAKKHNIDIVIIDTAGRLQNKESLMKELEKIMRVTNPDMKIFVGESTTGNDATEQAKTFNELIDITGTILSKSDIDEKGGTMISVGYITKKPILFLGNGQGYGDLEVFNKKKIIKSLGL
jgi:fused signal recognition particle receptor